MIDSSQEVEGFEPAETFTLRSLETVKAVSDPLRVRILELMYKEPRTVKQVAAELGVPATKLYYHVNLLEEHGLIRAVSSRVVSGIIEKSYRIVARNINVDKSLFDLSPTDLDSSVTALLAAIFDTARDEIHAGLISQRLETSHEAAPLRRLMLGRTLNRLTAERASELFAKLTAVIEEFNADEVDVAEGESELYSLVTAMYPVPQPTTSKEGDRD
jgi:DNA-binding transcriptional ArsR family regulator